MSSNILARAIRLATVVAAAGLAATPVLAAAPMAGTAAPGYYRFMLGNFEITALSDGTMDLPVDQLLHEPAEKTLVALHAAFEKAPLQVSDNAYLVNTGRRLVLIDTGAGDLFGPTLGKLMSNLKASGYQPGQVDDIFLTHLHPDHVGGLVRNHVIQFPNAVVHADRVEAGWWLSRKNLDSAPEASRSFFQDAMASVEPYVQAGKFSAFDGAVEFVPGVKSCPSFGHTPGHTSYLIESAGKRLLLMGDLIHVPAVQFEHPDVTIAFDSDPGEAAAARAGVFSQAARERTLVAGAHLPFPGLGHLRVSGKGYQWAPIDYDRMPARQ